MWNFIKKLFVFRVGQTSARGAARLIGLGRLGLVIGLIGGIRALRRHRHA
jgi:hypothetical protein